MLNRLSIKCNLYVPTLKYAFKILECTEFTKKKENSRMSPFDFLMNVKVQKTYLKTFVFWNGLFVATLDVIVECLAVYSK